MGGLGRNEPCWCGSGKKYKKCHLGRSEQPQVPHWEAAKEHRRHFGAKMCLVPPPLKGACSGEIVRAHTVPKSGSLKRLARDGHVYAFVPTLQNIQKGEGVLRPELLGINKASTFTGFCSKHDKEIFAPVEDEVFDFSDRQCFLLAYRAMTRELFTKNAAFGFSDFMGEVDKGRPIQEQFGIQEFLHFHRIGLAAGVSDCNNIKSLYDDVLTSQDFGSVRSYVIKFDQPLPVMCSGGILPEIDFGGHPIQDLGDLNHPGQAIYFTSFAPNGGAVVFTWLPGSDLACNQFITTLQRIPDEALSSALIRFFFEFCENVFLNPEWWEGLEEDQRQRLIDRLSSSADPGTERKANCLMDDGVSYVSVPVRERYLAHRIEPRGVMDPSTVSNPDIRQLVKIEDERGAVKIGGVHGETA